MFCPISTSSKPEIRLTKESIDSMTGAKTGLEIFSKIKFLNTLEDLLLGRIKQVDPKLIELKSISLITFSKNEPIY